MQPFKWLAVLTTGYVLMYLVITMLYFQGQLVSDISMLWYKLMSGIMILLIILLVYIRLTLRHQRRTKNV